MAGRVRAVLWRHLVASGAPVPQGPGLPDDPNAFVPVERFRAALEDLATLQGTSALRDAAAGYVALWARTFPTLVRQLRGRPEHALRLWCHEVYPFLRGERRAARVTSLDRKRAEALLAEDLPPAYLGGLVEAFVGLSGATATVHAAGAERYQVRFHIHPSDRFARAIHGLAALRIPLLITSALAASVGVALAALAGARLTWAPLVIIGTVAAQGAANALHDLRTPKARGPLDAPGLSRIGSWTQVMAGYAIAAGAAAWFVLQGRPLVLAFAAGGLALSLLYTRFRDQGLGPIVAGLMHGPIILFGTLYVLVGAAAFVQPWTALLVSAPLGFLTSATLYLDDLAERPLDQASGKRTLAVRLPRTRQLAAFLVLVTVGVGALVAATLLTGPPLALLLATPALLLALRVSQTVRRNMDDPRSLAGARLGTFALHLVASSAVLCLFAIEAFA